MISAMRLRQSPFITRMSVITALLCAIVMSSAVQAQRTVQTSTERQIYAYFDRHEYQAALNLIQQYLKDSPNDYNMLYNAACAQALLGHKDEAATTLLRAVKAGFRDFGHLQTDADLDSIHQHPTYLAILEASEKVAAEAGKSAVDRWRDEYGTKNYRYATDDEHRLNYATALDADADKRMRTMLASEADQLIKTLFEKPPTYYVLIAVPTPNDSDKFFKGDDSIGGMYDHTLKRLVARDIGGSLRHEFFHALHFGNMERLHQQHPLWIQEGLACLYEDYEISVDGSIKFLPNDRQSVVMNRARAGILIKWKDLFALSAKQFMAKAPEMYPQVRSIFEFVADKGKLTEWYKAYTTNFDTDRTGSKALEIVFKQPIAEVEKTWRLWVAAQPPVNLMIRQGDASLGVRVADNGSNDGVYISEVIAESAAARAGIRRGDVIISIDDHDTPSPRELRETIAPKSPGETVKVRYRRKGDYFTVNIRLQALGAGM